MKKLLIGMLLFLGISLSANGQDILGPRQTGVIQDMVGNGPGELVISGTLYRYDLDVTQFTLRGRPISDGELELGMVVRFTVRDGILQQIEVLGPNNLIEGLDEQGILD